MQGETGHESQSRGLIVFGSKPQRFGYFRREAPAPTRARPLRRCHNHLLLHACRRAKPLRGVDQGPDSGGGPGVRGYLRIRQTALGPIHDLSPEPHFWQLGDEFGSTAGPALDPPGVPRDARARVRVPPLDGGTGIPLGVVAANGAGRWPDHLVRTFYLSGWATPTYLGGLILAIVVGPALGLPYTGNFSSAKPPGWEIVHMSVLDAIIHLDPGALADAILHLILPATALAFLNMGIATRMTRGSMLEILPMDFVKTARMKGLTNFWVLYRHALRNALISTTTVLGIAAGGLLSGTVVIENIFRWPGIGTFAFNAIIGYEFAETIGIVIVFALGVVLANLIADVLYGLLDPRVEWR